MRRFLVALLTLLLLVPDLPARAAAPDPLPQAVGASNSDGVLAVNIHLPSALLQPGESALVDASVYNVSQEPVTVVQSNPCTPAVVVVGLLQQAHQPEACVLMITSTRLAPGESAHATFVWDGTRPAGVYHLTAVAHRAQQQGGPVPVSVELVLQVGDFSDMQGHWAASLVRRAGELGLGAGFPDGGFHPDAPVSTGQFLTLLDHAVGLPPMVSGNHWAAPWASAARAVGIVDEPDLNLDEAAPRGQLAVWLGRASGAPPSQTGKSSFHDLDGLSALQRGYVATLEEMGVASGYQGAFHPLSPATRAEAMAMLVRLYDYLAPRPGPTAQVRVGDTVVDAKVLAGTTLVPELIAVRPMARALGASLGPHAGGSVIIGLGERSIEFLPGSPRALVQGASPMRCIFPEGCPSTFTGGYLPLGRPALALAGELYLPADAFSVLGVPVQVSHPAAPGR